jgi:hypothetical protein
MVPAYPLLEADPFYGQSNGQLINFSLYDQADRVFNFGAGLELKIKEVLSFYSSYSTDFSYVPTDIEYFADFATVAYNSTFRADINHIGAGFVLKLRRADITLGTTYAWSREYVPRPIDFPDEGEEGGVFESNDTAELLWSRWRFIFSFSVPFLKDVQQKLDVKGEDVEYP